MMKCYTGVIESNLLLPMFIFLSKLNRIKIDSKVNQPDRQNLYYTLMYSRKS